MPGANCSVYGCSSSRLITKDRVGDNLLKRQIENCTLNICEKHFSEKQIVQNEKRKRMVPGSIPHLNLLQKTLPATSTLTKRRLSAANIAAKKHVANHISTLASKLPAMYDEIRHDFMASHVLVFLVHT
ncbi:uncharacterized protein LOC130657204 [Hydractinia symbiolongicarpus]|uniref:uncharacterized protein LOC130657204 n=1 Tax=Hydractinia symbiolongicarpus TaxID=13093 RepID=UPI00254DA2B9|nr:uncharacterized protein LOC130657204 [Hydractinia symbiolongicarpus]